MHKPEQVAVHFPAKGASNEKDCYGCYTQVHLGDDYRVEYFHIATKIPKNIVPMTYFSAILWEELPIFYFRIKVVPRRIKCISCLET